MGRLRNIGRLRAATSGFSPLSLFAAGEQGAWYDPSDFSTLFQDSAGTTPVTAVGQPVGKILDKSGRGNHQIQATTTSRFTVQQDGSGFFYFNVDGVDDSSSSAATVNLSATSQLQFWAGVRKNSDASAGILAELTTSAANAGSFGVQAPNSAGNYRFEVDGSVVTGRNATTYTAPISNVLSCAFDTGAGVNLNILPRIDGVVPTLSSSVSSGTGNLSNATLYIGARAGAGIFFSGRIYQMIIRGVLCTAAEISNCERYIGSKMGIAL
jgi:hypothetical protein